MSFKRYCDRCGAIIDPPTSYLPVRVGHELSNICEKTELCVSCEYKLKKFLKAEDVDNGSDYKETRTDL